jgi:hypothetical protein
MNRAVGAAQASAQLTADGGDQLNGDGRLFFRQGGTVGGGQGIADQILVGDDRGGARLPIENGELAEHCSGRTWPVSGRYPTPRTGGGQEIRMDVIFLSS